MSTEVPSSPEPGQDPKEERTWAMVCHLAALAGYIIPVAGNIVGPLIVWLMKKEQFALVNDQGKVARTHFLDAYVRVLHHAVR